MVEVDGNRLPKTAPVERGVFLTQESDKRKVIALFLSDSLGVNPHLEGNSDLTEKIGEIAESAVKVIDYKNINRIKNGVELTFNKHVIDPNVIVRNFKKHGIYYGHSGGLIHYLREDVVEPTGKNVLMYNEKEPLKLTVITGGIPVEKVVYHLNKFFKNFNWSEPEQKEHAN